jgi:hypothetical protein
MYSIIGIAIISTGMNTPNEIRQRFSQTSLNPVLTADQALLFANKIRGKLNRNESATRKRSHIKGIAHSTNRGMDISRELVIQAARVGEIVFIKENKMANSTDNITNNTISTK